MNLWRLGAFVSNSLTVQIEPFDLNSVRDLVVSGVPVLLALSLNNLGSHFVVASGVASDGSIQITDPNPAFAQTNLTGYLNGFTAAGQRLRGVLTEAARLLPQAPSSAGFFVASTASITLGSAAGSWWRSDLPRLAAAAAAAQRLRPLQLALYFCCLRWICSFVRTDDAAAGWPVQPDVHGFFLPPARVLRAGRRYRHIMENRAGKSAMEPGTAQYDRHCRESSTPPATPTKSRSGGLISIFGAGLAGAFVQIAGQPARVIAATPSQINAQIPSIAATAHAIDGYVKQRQRATAFGIGNYRG